MEAARAERRVAVVERRVWRPRETEAWVGCVRLSPDGKRLAYGVVTEDAAAILVEDEAGEAREVLLCEAGMLPEDLAWSPDGRRLAVLQGEDETRRCKRVVTWVDVEAGSLDEVMASAFAWQPSSSEVVVFSAENKTVASFGVADNVVRMIGRATDSGDPCYPPRLAVTRDARRVALATRSTFDDRLSVRVFERDEQGGEVRASHVTEVPGAEAYACPFWSPRGVSLGVLVSHPGTGRSGIVVFRGGEGDGHLVYQSDLCDPPVTPAWSRHGVAFMQTVERGDDTPARLAWLDVDSGAVTPLSDPGEAHGTPRLFPDKTIVVDGDDAAYLFGLARGREARVCLPP